MLRCEWHYCLYFCHIIMKYVFEEHQLRLTKRNSTEEQKGFISVLRLKKMTKLMEPPKEYVANKGQVGLGLVCTSRTSI